MSFMSTFITYIAIFLMSLPFAYAGGEEFLDQEKVFERQGDLHALSAGSAAAGGTVCTLIYRHGRKTGWENGSGRFAKVMGVRSIRRITRLAMPACALTTLPFVVPDEIEGAVEDYGSAAASKRAALDDLEGFLDAQGLNKIDPELGRKPSRFVIDQMIEGIPLSEALLSVWSEPLDLDRQKFYRDTRGLRLESVGTPFISEMEKYNTEIGRRGQAAE